MEYICLNDIAKYKQGKQVSIDKQHSTCLDGMVRFVRIVDYSNSNEMPRYIENLGQQYIVDEKSIVMIRYGSQTAGKVVRGISGIIANNMFQISIDDDRFDNDYMYYFLSSSVVNQLLMGGQSSSTMPAITFGMLKQIQVPVRSIDEQRKIASFLESIDKKIENNNKINDNLLEQIQALYKAWFVDYLPFGGVKPESWTQTDIYSLANIIYGAPFASKQFNTEGNGKPIIRIRDLKDQQFATYTTEVHPKGYLLQPGDIVVGMDGEFRPYIWGNDEAWLNQRVCVFENKRPNGKAFLYFTIKPLLFAIEQTQVATTVIHIGKKDYDAFEITLPDSSTLDSFDALTSPMITRIVSNSFENKRLAAMRDTLLPKLLSGELDVSDIQI